MIIPSIQSFWAIMLLYSMTFKKGYFFTFWPLFDIVGTLFSLRTKLFSKVQALLKLICYFSSIFIYWLSIYASYRVKGELFVTPTKSGLILLNFFSSMSKKLKIPLSVWIRMTVLINLSTNKPLLYTNLAVRMIKNWTREGILRKDHFFDLLTSIWHTRNTFFFGYKVFFWPSGSYGNVLLYFRYFHALVNELCPL